MTNKIPIYLIVAILLVSLAQATSLVVQCADDSDCPKPLKAGCEDFFVGCNNICIYNPNSENRIVCENEVVTIIKQWEKLQEQIVVDSNALNTLTFSQNQFRTKFNFGNQIFTAEVPEFLCESTYTPDSDYINPPYPSNDCWGTAISFMSDFNLKNQETKVINNYISVKYIISGGTYITGNIDNSGWTTNFKNDDWANTFIFTIKDGLNLNLEPENRYIKKDIMKTISLKITNNLPSNSNAFVKIKQVAKQTNKILQDAEYPISLEQGVNEIQVPINTENYGINEIEVQAFYIIDADSQTLMKSDRILTNYNVVDNIPTFPENTQIDTEEPDGSNSLEGSSNTLLILLAVIIGFALLRRVFS